MTGLTINHVSVNWLASWTEALFRSQKFLTQSSNATHFNEALTPAWSCNKSCQMGTGSLPQAKRPELLLSTNVLLVSGCEWFGTITYHPRCDFIGMSWCDLYLLLSHIKNKTKQWLTPRSGVPEKLKVAQLLKFQVFYVYPKSHYRVQNNPTG